MDVPSVLIAREPNRCQVSSVQPARSSRACCTSLVYVPSGKFTVGRRGALSGAAIPNADGPLHALLLYALTARLH